MPHIKRITMRVVPDESTRLAQLKNGEVDIAYLMVGAIGEGVGPAIGKLESRSGHQIDDRARHEHLVIHVQGSHASTPSALPFSSQ